jgi:Beta-glucanase/Beta-glucan synthetase
MRNKLLTLFTLPLLTIVSFSCSKKSSSSTPPATVPVVNIQDAEQTRSTANGTIHFSVSLDKTTSVPVSVDYTLQNGTATAPKDYVAASGTVTIPANQSNAEIAIQITGDPNNTRQDNLQFTVVLSNPKNATLGVTSAKGTIVTQNGTYFVTDTTGYSTPMSYPGYSLVWDEEFNGSTLDPNEWNYEIGNGSGGWGNNELEYYTNSTNNAFVSNGNLIIEARKESINGFNYSSARLTTQNKKTFTYGRVDIRAKLPRGQGVWPALWMLGSNINTVGWPASGEIDIMELLGQDSTKVYETLHYGASLATHASKGNTYTSASPNFSSQFHVFSMDWKQDTVKLYVDNKLILAVNKSDVSPSPYPFNQPFFFIFNVAVGGNFPGNPDGTTTFPQRMIVDYIRVFQ